MSILVLDNLSKTSGINIILFVDGKTLIPINPNKEKLTQINYF